MDIQDVADICASFEQHMPGCEVVIKIHPAERVDKYDGVGVEVVVSDLFEHILWADVVVSKDSSTLLEAMVLHRPVISYKPAKLMYFVRADVVQIVHDRSGLDRLLSTYDRSVRAVLRSQTEFVNEGIVLD